jgi:3',5'-cyclic AMP phosphodiesterase CpdA
MPTETVFLHLSDTHILADDGDLLGMNPTRSLRRVLDYIADLPIAPRFCLLSGDLAQDGKVESYVRLRELLAPLAARGLPILACPGNHDTRAAFRRGFLGQDSDDDTRLQQTVTIDGLRVILLDSLVPGSDHGELGPDQLAWLAGELAEPAERGTLIVLHHPVELAAMPWLDNDLLRDADALRDLLADKPILGVLAGHCHAASATPFAGTLAATVPAVVFQARVGVPRMEIVDASGFALCTVRSNGLNISPIMV